MLVINFQKLWESHPINWGEPDNFPCKKADGITPSYTNECAIKMSLALIGAGVDMNKCPKTRCDYGR